MVKAAAAKAAQPYLDDAIKALVKDPRAQKALAGAGASVIDTVLDNPVISAAEGALIGGAIGGPPGAIGGGIAGWFLGDKQTVFPIDMICIPAYEAYMIQGTPAFTVYARAGETLVPTGGNVQDVQQVATPTMSAPKKPVKLTKWNKYVKNKKNHIRHKSGKNKGKLNLKAMAKKGGFGRKK